MGPQLNPLDLLPAMEAASEDGAGLRSACCNQCFSSLDFVTRDQCD